MGRKAKVTHTYVCVTMDEEKEEYMPHYKGFEFFSKRAQYEYLRSLWPHHQHKILAYMQYKIIMGREPYVTIDEIAAELKINKGRSYQDLMKMVRRGHLKKDTLMKQHKYILTDQGYVYSNNVFQNYKKYNLDIMRYVKDISTLPELPIGSKGGLDESISSEERSLVKQWAMEIRIQEMEKQKKKLDEMK
jgi:predicted DNA-binding transcriptional regulator